MMVVTKEINRLGMITIPKYARDALRLKPGDRVHVVVKGNKEIQLIPERNAKHLLEALSENNPE